MLLKIQTAYWLSVTFVIVIHVIDSSVGNSGENQSKVQVLTNTTAQIASTSSMTSNCYAEAVYKELMRSIEVIDKMHKPGGSFHDKFYHDSSSLKKLQDDEDDGVITDIIDFAPIIPMIVKIVGSALSLNSSGVTEGSYGFIPERVSNQITNVLGSLANSILGTQPTPPSPPKRRRRTTTAKTKITTSRPIEIETTYSTTEMNEVKQSSTEANIPIPTPTTEETLFKASDLGDLPVYAVAYAPYYVATTPYPVYASKFLHILYPVPTTTTVATTTTTTSDPNSFAVDLPFDYQVEGTSSPYQPNTTVVAGAEEDDYDENEEATEDTNKGKLKNTQFPN